MIPARRDRPRPVLGGEFVVVAFPLLGYHRIAAFAGGPAAAAAGQRVLRRRGVLGDLGNVGAADVLGRPARRPLRGLPQPAPGLGVGVLLAVYERTHRRLLRGLAVAHLALTVLIVLNTGNHYLLDVGAGVALAVACWCAGTRWAAWPRWTPEPAGTRPAQDMAPTAPR
jgi:hypothetical protein